MSIQIKELIIWPKDKSKEKKIISFKLGKLNIIHGASQTGKSAIISIIDYCLCSSSNKIPIGPIRDNVSWFGIKLILDSQELLIARENKEKSGGKFFFKLGVNVEVIDTPFINESNVNELKKNINNILGIPFFKLNEFSSKGERPSFRDLVSFNFQAQNIVANPNCLLYKSDIAEYRNRLKEIFNFAIGVENGETLLNKQLYVSIKQALEKLIKEKESKQKFIDDELLNQQDFILTSMKYGLVNPNDFEGDNLDKIRDCLNTITSKSLSDIGLSIDGAKLIADRYRLIQEKIDPLVSELRSYEISKESLENIISLSRKNIDSLKQKGKPLKIAKFIKEFYMNDPKDIEVIPEIDKLCSNLESIEEKIRNTNFSKNSLIEKKLGDVNQKINSLTLEVNQLLSEYKNLHNSSKDKNIFEDFLSKISKAKTILELSQSLSDNDDKITELKNKLPSILNIKNSLTIALADIKFYMEKYLPSFSEFKEVSTFDQENLAIKVIKGDENYFLWETGSGSNWVAYHLAALLGFHLYFIINNCPVFNFIIFDQPSQVYFPTSRYNKDKKIYEFDEKSSDYKYVKEMYGIMDKAITDSNNRIQIIVLDHTDESMWKDLVNINEVANWTEDALIPSDWI